MEGILKVTPEQLVSTAGEFESIGATVRNLTQNMTDTVTSLSGAWEGESSAAYISKFNGLQDDITRMHAMIAEHVKDLNDMASRYMEAEKQVASEVEALSSDVIV